MDGSTATLDGHGEKVHDRFFGQSSFATYALANERNVVKVVATGLCHTDMVASDKGYPVPQPIVLGHEGAGIVERA